jgi:hypothetical protein
MSQTIAVAVKGFSVTKCIDPKSKTEIPTKFKPKAVSLLKSVQVDPPKGKTLGPYSVDIAVAILMAPKGLKAEVKILFSQKDIYLGEASGSASVQTTNPDKGDTEAAVEAALGEAIKTVIGGIKNNAKKP